MSPRTHSEIEALEARTLLSDVVASFKATQYGSHTFLFNSHSSKPGDAKKIEKALWRFGDGTHTYGGIVFHTFAAAGTYNVQLKVTNGLGQSDDETRTVQVGSTEWSASINGRLFNDRNFNRIRDSKKENWIANEKVWVDQNEDGVFDWREGRYTTTDAEGRFSLQRMQGGRYLIRTSPEGILVHGDNGSRYVEIANGQMKDGQDLFAQMGGTLTGQVAPDKIRNGRHDSYEQNDGRPRTVWLDANGDGSLNFGERSTQTDFSGNYTFKGVPGGSHRVRVQLHSGESQISPRPSRGLDVNVVHNAVTTAPTYMLVLPNNSSVSGTVFDDIDGDATHEPGEALLAGKAVYLDIDRDDRFDPGEPSTLTNSSGAYNIPARAYESFYENPSFAQSTQVFPRVVPQSGQRQSFKRTGAYSYDSPRIQPGEPATDVKLGLTTTVSFRGELFFDSNGNGKNDDFDNINPSGIVFADLNDNNLIDDDEAQASTNYTGEWAFPIGLNAGSYVIRILISSSRLLFTTPAFYRLTVKPGEDSLLNFGVNYGN